MLGPLGIHWHLVRLWVRVTSDGPMAVLVSQQWVHRNVEVSLGIYF